MGIAGGTEAVTLVVLAREHMELIAWRNGVECRAVCSWLETFKQPKMQHHGANADACRRTRLSASDSCILEHRLSPPIGVADVNAPR